MVSARPGWRGMRRLLVTAVAGLCLWGCGSEPTTTSTKKTAPKQTEPPPVAHPGERPGSTAVKEPEPAAPTVEAPPRPDTEPAASAPPDIKPKAKKGSGLPPVGDVRSIR